MAQDPRLVIIADELKKRTKKLVEMENDYATRLASLEDREKRVAYREEMAAKRERKIYGQSSL